MMPKRTLLDVINTMPPNIVRVQARTGTSRACRPLTSKEISERSGLSQSKVKLISKRTTWLHTKVEDMIRFCAACGIELLHQRNAIQFAHETDNYKKAVHLKKAWFPNYYKALLNGTSATADWRVNGLQATRSDSSPVQAEA